MFLESLLQFCLLPQDILHSALMLLLAQDVLNLHMQLLFAVFIFAALWPNLLVEVVIPSLYLLPIGFHIKMSLLLVV